MLSHERTKKIQKYAEFFNSNLFGSKKTNRVLNFKEWNKRKQILWRESEREKEGLADFSHKNTGYEEYGTLFFKDFFKLLI